MTPLLATIIGLALLLAVLAFAIARPRVCRRRWPRCRPPASRSRSASISPAERGGRRAPRWHRPSPSWPRCSSSRIWSRRTGCSAGWARCSPTAVGGDAGRLLVLVFAAAADHHRGAEPGRDGRAADPGDPDDRAADAASRGAPHVYATAHLSNSASLLLPVSNLTNLLAYHASGLTFLGFAGVDGRRRGWSASPSSTRAFRLFFRSELRTRAATRTAPRGLAAATSRHREPR